MKKLFRVRHILFALPPGKMPAWTKVAVRLAAGNKSPKCTLDTVKVVSPVTVAAACQSILDRTDPRAFLRGAGARCQFKFSQAVSADYDKTFYTAGVSGVART